MPSQVKQLTARALLQSERRNTGGKQFLRRAELLPAGCVLLREPYDRIRSCPVYQVRRLDEGEHRTACGEELLEQRDCRLVQALRAHAQNDARVGTMFHHELRALVFSELAENLLVAQIVLNLAGLQNIQEILESPADFHQTRACSGMRGIHPGGRGRL